MDFLKMMKQAKQMQEAPVASEAAQSAPGDLVKLCTELLRLDPSARPDGSAVAAALPPAGGPGSERHRPHAEVGRRRGPGS